MRKWAEDRFAGGSCCRPETRFSRAGLQEWRGGRGLRSIRTIVVALLISLMWSAASLAQTPQPMPPGPPQNPLRPELGPNDQSEENFSFLRNPADRTDFWDPLVGWRDGKETRETAVAQIARRYREFVDIFEQNHTKASPK